MASLAPALVAALGALLVFFAASWTFTMAAPSVWLDANFRARISQDVVQTADRLESKHRPLSEIARTILARIDLSPGFTAAVVSDSGKLLGGNQALVGNRPPGFPPEAPRPRNAAFRGSLYPLLRPPNPPGALFFRGPLTSVVSPPSFVRITGASVIFAPEHDVLSTIQSTERMTVIILVTLTFVLVWLIARRILVGAVRPMDGIRAALRRLSQGDYARFETFSEEDNVAGELVEAYNAAASEMATVSQRGTAVESKIRQFVADAGHELRTPLAVIMGYVQLLHEGDRLGNPMSNRVFSEIEDQGKRMSVLIQKLLLLTRLESQDPQDVKILDAADVAQNVIDSFRPLSNGATLRVNAQSNSFVQVSESELREAIGNLVDNALKYAPGANIEASVRTEGNTVFIAVSDDGPGMTPDMRARAFERFSRGEMGGSITGSGLGLAIVERAVERTGGSVSLNTALGKGTTVEMRLPAWSVPTN